MWVAEVFRRPASAGSGSGSGSSAGSGSSGTTKKPSKAAPAASTPDEAPVRAAREGAPPEGEAGHKAGCAGARGAGGRRTRGPRDPAGARRRAGPGRPDRGDAPRSRPANPRTDGTDLPAPAAAALGVLAFVVLAAAARLRLT